MASICFDLMTTKLLNLKEIFDRLDPKRFSEVMEDAIMLMLDSIVEEVAMKYMPNVWSMNAHVGFDCRRGCHEVHAQCLVDATQESQG